MLNTILEERYEQGETVAGDIVTRAEVKEWCNVTHDGFDSVFDALILSTVQTIIRYLNRSLLTTTWTKIRSNFCLPIELRRGRFQSIESIKFLKDTNLETLPATEYEVAKGGIFGQVCTINKPSHDTSCNAVEIEFKAGFGDLSSDIPDDIKQAIKFMICDWKTNRGDCVECSSNETISINSSALSILQNYRYLQI